MDRSESDRIVRKFVKENKLKEDEVSEFFTSIQYISRDQRTTFSMQLSCFFFNIDGRHISGATFNA